jgi:hypothetical protein
VRTHLQILQFFRRISVARKFDMVAARSHVEAMSGLDLFKHGRRFAETCWLVGRKRPLTMREIGELRAVREEWHKRQSRGAREPSRRQAETLAQPGSCEIEGTGERGLAAAR